MEKWDMKMQLECANSLHKEAVIALMTSKNQVKTMDECITIILNADITQEEVTIITNINVLIVNK